MQEKPYKPLIYGPHSQNTGATKWDPWPPDNKTLVMAHQEGYEDGDEQKEKQELKNGMKATPDSPKIIMQQKTK